jgi:hypothetical protein
MRLSVAGRGRACESLPRPFVPEDSVEARREEMVDSRFDIESGRVDSWEVWSWTFS